MEKEHALWPGGPVYAGDAVTADSLALAAFALGVPGERAADLGCGCGLLALLLCAERPGLRLDGVEIRPGAAERCRENLARNGLSERCLVVCADLRAHPLPEGVYDLVVSNPPYFAAGRGAVSPDGERALMRTESAALPELAAAAAALLAPGGSFCLVHRAQRRSEVMAALGAAHLTPVRLRELLPRSGAKAKLFLVEARRGPGELLTEPPLCQFGPEGKETREYRKICHWE